MTSDLEHSKRRPPATATFSDLLVTGLGFRPFFLVAGVLAALIVPVWVANYLGYLSLVTYYEPVNWHGHEMVFGFTVAVIAGFLLTAVRGWTGYETARGFKLLGLVAVWLAGRLAPLVPLALPRSVIAAADLAFLPCLLAVIVPPLWRDGRARNLAVVPVLLALFVANVLVHLEVLGFTTHAARTGTYMAVDVVGLLIVVVGGRVIPFFTERAVAGARVRRNVAVEWTAIGSAAALVALAPFARSSTAAMSFAGVAATANLVRLAFWHDRRVWRLPLLWVLYLGYGWLACGFALRALAIAGTLPAIVALHAATAGAIGVLTLGMMARVSLGHTGRPLDPPAMVVAAFVLANLAVVARVVLPIVAPASYAGWLATAAVLWTAAFGLFLVTYVPVLVRPRIDGRAG
ncbi:MAG: NnrS family protein [Deltaproteobacteria bacterium]|nr:MAG: NnrS family protein [Deltaproteobacteria bacterium]